MADTRFSLDSRTAALIALVALVTLAGCSSVVGGLEIQRTDTQTTMLGNVEVGATVENSAGDSQSGTLVAQVEVQGETHTARRQITVPGGETNTYTLTVDIPVLDSISADQYSYDVFLDD